MSRWPRQIWLGSVIVLLLLAAPTASAQDAGAAARLVEQVRHELAMLPYISVFDYITFGVNGSKVTLSGYTVRPTNKSSAENVVKRVEGIDEVDNQIEVLPLSSHDRRIRARVRIVLQRWLPRYFAGTQPSIRIIVKRGDVILKGFVDREQDKQIANVQVRTIPGVFQVTNDLEVRPPG